MHALELSPCMCVYLKHHTQPLGACVHMRVRANATTQENERARFARCSTRHLPSSHLVCVCVSVCLMSPSGVCRGAFRRCCNRQTPALGVCVACVVC